MLAKGIILKCVPPCPMLHWSPSNLQPLFHLSSIPLCQDVSAIRIHIIISSLHLPLFVAVSKRYLCLMLLLW